MKDQVDENVEDKKKSSPMMIFIGCVMLILLAVSIFFGGSGEDRREREAKEAAISAIKADLADPSSLDIIGEGSRRAKDGTYYVIIKFRAKNALGAYVLAENRVVVSEDGIVLRKY